MGPSQVTARQVAAPLAIRLDWPLTLGMLKAMDQPLESKAVREESAKPTKRSRRRWFQFSLRGVLVLTLIAIVLNWYVNRAVPQRRAKEAIRKAQGSILYSSATPGGVRSWLRNHLHDDYFDPIFEVKFHYALDAGLVDLHRFTSLKRLDIGHSRVTDAGMVHLSGLTSLETLGLNRTQVSDAGLVHLAPLTSLEKITLSSSAITNNGLVHLRGLTSLRWLSLQETLVTDAGLVHLQGLTRLKFLFLDQTQVTDAGLAHLKRIPSLGWLGLSDTQVTDAGLVHLRGLTSLRWLDLRHTQVTDAGVARLALRLPKCNIAGPNSQ